MLTGAPAQFISLDMELESLSSDPTHSQTLGSRIEQILSSAVSDQLKVSCATGRTKHQGI